MSAQPAILLLDRAGEVTDSNNDFGPRYNHEDPEYAARLSSFRDHCDADEAGEMSGDEPEGDDEDGNE